MKLKNNLFGIAAFSLCMSLASCSDDELPYSEAQVTNTELRTILEKQGIQFDETGHMLLDDKVQNLTKLDLTGTKFTDFKALTILPSLNELDLSDNEFGPAFDFSTLPAQITGVDLTGNEIYDYNNLIKVEIAENGDETITNLRDLKKLHLPDEAEGNTTDLVRYYRQNKDAITNGTIDMQMADESGKLAKYTTLRNIPDEALRTFLNNEKQFSSIFEGDQIDLSKRFNKEQKINPVIINPYLTENFADIKSFEGLQYIVSSPYWEGTRITIQFANLALPEIKVPSTVTNIDIANADASKGFDISNATGIISLSLREVSGIESVDLSACKTWGQRDKQTEEEGFGSELYVLGCKEVKSIIFPKADVLRAFKVDIEGLPALETCDFSKFSYLHGLSIGDLADSYKLVYPNITEFPTQPVDIPRPMDVITFACSEKTYAIPATTEFINKYKKYEGKRKIMRGRLKFDTDKYWR